MDNIQDIDPNDGVLRRYQLVQLVRHMPPAMLFSIASCIVLSIVLSFVFSLAYISVWSIIIIAASLYGYQSARRPIDETGLKDAVDKKTAYKALGATIGYGLLWGLGLATFYPVNNFEFELLVILSATGMTLGAVTVAGAWATAALAFGAAVIAPLIARQLMIGDVSHITLAIYLFLYAIGLGAISVIASRALAQSLSMRFRNESLIDDLRRRETNLQVAREAAEVAQSSAEVSAELAEDRTQFLEGVLQNISQGLVVYDKDLSLVAWNEEFIGLLGLPSDFNETLDTYEKYLRYNAEREEYGEGEVEALVEERLNHWLPDGAREAEKYERTRTTGQILEVISNPLPDGGMIKTYTDISERKRTELTIRRLAMRDPLTGLANRNQFNRELDRALEKAGFEGNMVAVLILDLDKFKPVNDTFGHPTGDKLLKVVAKRLLDCARSTDTVARLGGDEFAIIMNNIRDIDAVVPPAARIIHSLSEPIVIDGYRHRIGTSIGISFYPLDDMEKSELLRKADVAMYEAKAAGRGNYKFYDADSHANAVASKILEDALRDGLAQEEFVLHYQPQVSGDTNELIGAEALIRWHRPGRGLVPPGDFIPAAEASGLIGPMGEWALFAACRQAAEWIEAGLPAIRVAVNVSVVQFHRENFVDTVARALRESKLDPNLLEIEITEGAMMNDIDQVIKKLDDLNELGVCLAVDDFGTGYSSLAYLKKLPVHRLKIDKSFVDGVGLDADDSAIADAVITLGKTLKLEVVAEGVETADQQAYLQARDCEILQGYYFAAPMPAQDFFEWYGKSLSQTAKDGASGD